MNNIPHKAICFCWMRGYEGGTIMKFILLHQVIRGETTPIWVNVEYILTIVPETEDKYARVYTKDFNFLAKESSGDILTAIRRAESDGI